MKKIKKLYIRNFLTTAAILLLSFAILAAALAAATYRFLINERRDNIMATSRDILILVESSSLYYGAGSLDMRMALASISRSSGSHIVVADSDGYIVSCSDDPIYDYCTHIGMQISYDTVQQIVYDYKSGGVTNLDDVYEVNRYVIGMELRSLVTGRMEGYVFISNNLSSVVRVWRNVAGMFVLIIAVVMAIAFIASIITTKKQARPINEMANAARRFARGDFDVRVSETGRSDEIGQLADAFNVMADSMERAEAQRREFVANVSHELKTPMTTITGFAEGILDGTIPREKQDEYMRVISSETKRLSRLVRSMLDMSHIQGVDDAAITGGRFDAAEVLRISLVSLEKKITDKGLDVEAQLPEEPMDVRGDMDSITQVAYNLIDNAIKFSDRGTTIRLDLWKQGAKAYISVENTGYTIPEDELPLIFDRFHKTDRSRNADKDGVGLGLYIVKTILDMHGEDVFVSSREGVTKFVFTLTVSQE